MISVILATRNPHLGRLARTLSGLSAQADPGAPYEIILVDNASTTPWQPPADIVRALPRFQRLDEPEVGLTPARLRGIAAASGDLLVFVDDDNVLAPGYLSAVARRFTSRPSLGAAGGPVVPEWESSPPEWSREFHGLLALRDLGPAEQIARGTSDAAWPAFAPVGAGLAISREHALAYANDLTHDARRRRLDRTGASLASGGDSDLVFTTLHRGGDVAYFPELSLTHLIPSARLAPKYLARLNRGIMRSWVNVLALHGQSPWPPIAPATVPLRQARAWWRTRAWRGPAEWIRWQGRCGQFEGQADVSRAASA